MTKPHYIHILFDILKFPREFLKRNCKMIRTRLLSALAVTRTNGVDTQVFSPNEDIFVINQCMHLASSVLLLGSKEEDIESAIRHVRSLSGIEENDPTTVLSIVMLYYIIRKESQKLDASEDEKRLIERVCNMFQRINWVIGSAGMQVLELNDLQRKQN